ncbi:MAG: hypothetical protein QW351_05400 [Candidatus Caldarchaeum sp.]
MRREELDVRGVVKQQQKTFEAIDKRFEAIDRRFERLEASIEELRRDVDRKLDRFFWLWVSTVAAGIALRVLGLL